MRTHHKKAAAPENESYRYLPLTPEKDSKQVWHITRTVHRTHFIHKSGTVVNAKKHWTPGQVIKHH